MFIFQLYIIIYFMSVTFIDNLLAVLEILLVPL